MKADIAMNFEASAAVGAVVCSQGGIPINGGHIQYWMGQAREARAERDAAARDMRERCAQHVQDAGGEAIDWLATQVRGLPILATHGKDAT